MNEIEQLKTTVSTTLGITDDESQNNWYAVEGYRLDAELFGDGNCEQESIATQIDLYYQFRTNRDTALSTLKQIIAENKSYTYPEIEMYFDEVADRFRATLSFKILR